MADEVKSPPPSAACVIPYFRGLWYTWSSCERTARGTSLKDTCEVPRVAYAHPDLQRDLDTLRSYCTTLDYNAESHQLAFDLTFRGQFAAAHRSANLSLCVLGEQIALAVYENGHQLKECLHFFLKPEGPEEQWKDRAPAAAKVTTRAKAARALHATLRRCTTDFHDLVLVSTSVAVAYSALERLLREQVADEPLCLPKTALCIDTQSRMLRSLLGGAVTEMLELALTCDMDFQDAGAIARRNGPVHALFTLLSGVRK